MSELLSENEIMHIISGMNSYKNDSDVSVDDICDDIKDMTLHELEAELSTDFELCCFELLLNAVAGKPVQQNLIDLLKFTTIVPYNSRGKFHTS